MGHKVGWLTLHAGIAGGADIILLPEIPYDLNVVCDALKKAFQQAKSFLFWQLQKARFSKEDAALSKKELKEKKKNSIYPSIAYEIGAKISEKTGQEVRVTVPGHMQEAENPARTNGYCPPGWGQGRKLIRDGRYGNMVMVRDGEITKIPLSETAGEIKIREDPKSSIIEEAKLVRHGFGDE